MYDLIVIGGGAAGVFAANAAKGHSPSSKVLLLERSRTLLAKVRVSGGGRCNVTHHCFDPQLLVTHYPRGGKELRGLFHRFQPQDTVEWFTSRGVPLKIEGDGRIFPESDSSESIIDCLLTEAERLGVEIRSHQPINTITKTEGGFTVELKEEQVRSRSLLLATGSHPSSLEWTKKWGHTIQPAVPSLFTFNVPHSPLNHLSGISLTDVGLKIENTSLSQRGPLLITHFGFSGPAVLKLSAWGARHFHEKNYQVTLLINWLPQMSEEEIFQQLLTEKEVSHSKLLSTCNLFQMPKNLWKHFIETLNSNKRLADVSQKSLQLLAKKLHSDPYNIHGKTTHKEEFVTCGGVTLKEVDFKTLESKVCPKLYFAGEILDIDGVTGGFNFQNAWSTGYIAGISSIL